MSTPIDVEISDDKTVAMVDIPLAGKGTDDVSTGRARHPA